MSVDSLSGGGEAALARADARARAAVEDLFLPDEARLGDRIRTVSMAMLRACVDAAEAAVRTEVARHAREAGEEATAQAALVPAGDAFGVLDAAGLLRNAELIEEIVAEAARDWLEERLLPEPDAGQRGLLMRLTGDPDAQVREAVSTFATVHLRARAALPLVGLPVPLQQHMLWQVAAAVRTDLPRSPVSDEILARAVASLAAAAGEEPLRQAAGQLAERIDGRPGSRGALLADVLRDRSPALFSAVLARWASLDYEQARMLLLQPSETLLWVALRSAGLTRAEMAEVATLLSDADPRRDLDLLADALDKAAALSIAAAEQALLPLRLHPRLRAAVRALGIDR